jgi:hypothetical protein
MCRLSLQYHVSTVSQLRAAQAIGVSFSGPIEPDVAKREWDAAHCGALD